MENISNLIDLMNYILGTSVTLENNPEVFLIYAVCGTVLFIFLFRSLSRFVLQILGLYRG